MRAFSLHLLCLLPFTIALASEPVPSQAPKAVVQPTATIDQTRGPTIQTDSSQFSLPTPSDFSVERFNGLMEKGATNHMTTRWGAMPQYEGLLPLIDEPDGLPETSPIDQLILDGVPLEAVLRKLAAQMHISYVSPPDLEGTITADYHALSPTNIFRSLTRMSQHQVASYYSAFTVEPIKPSAPIFRRYKLDFNYEDKSEGTGSTTTSSSASASGPGGSNGGGGGMSGANAAGLKPDYSDFLANIKTLATVTFANREVSAPVVVYDENEKVLTLHASSYGHAAVMTYLETVNHPQSNVALEIFVAETSLNPVTDLGIEWSFNSGYEVSFDRSVLPSGSVLKHILSPQGPSDSSSNSRPAGELPIGKLSLPNISATIRALQTDTRSRTYAHPRVLTTNNKPVTLESITEIPYTSSMVSANVGGSTSIGTANSTAFKRVGISVGMWPIIQGQGLLRMKASVSISSLQGYSPTDNQPIISQRSYGGNFTVESGEYIVIGGLGQSSFTNTQSAVPYLVNLPFIGGLFRTTQETKDTKHLLIFIRPVVLDRYNRGLAMDTMSKAAMFTHFKEGKLNFTPDGVYRNLSEARDPFVEAELGKSISDLEHRRTTSVQTLDVLRAERDAALSQHAQNLTSSRERSARISLEMREEQDPETLRRLAVKAAEEKERQERAKAVMEASKRSFEQAMDPVQKSMDDINRDLKAQKEAMDRLLDAERKRLATDPKLGSTAVTAAPAVRVDLGAQVTNDAGTPKLAEGKVESAIVITKAARPATVETPKADLPAGIAPKPPEQDVIEALFKELSKK